MQIFILGNQNNQPTEKVKKVKDDYERKLNDMQKEMKKLQTAKKEHSKMLRNQSQYESQIKTLRNEVTDMKKVKVGCSFLNTFDMTLPRLFADILLARHEKRTTRNLVVCSNVLKRYHVFCRFKGKEKMLALVLHVFKDSKG